MERLIKTRKEKGMTQAELAKRLGVSRSTVAMWETDGSQPDNEMLIKIANALGVSIDYLLGRETPSDDRFEGMDAQEILEFLANSPDGRVLFSLAKDASREDLLKMVKIIETITK